MDTPADTADGRAIARPSQTAHADSEPRTGADPHALAEAGVFANAHGEPVAAPAADEATGPVVAVVEAITSDHARAPDRLIEILHDVQHMMGYVPGDAVPEIARRLNLSRADVHGVLTFYDDFRTAPPPRHVLRLCGAEACQAVGADRLVRHLRDQHGLIPGNRNAARTLGVEVVYCLGNCAIGPAGEFDGAPLARLSPERLDALVLKATAAEAGQ